MRHGKSEAQAIAESRSRTFADEHARTWSVAFSRVEPRTLRDLCRDLRRAYQLDMPEKMHRSAVDQGGTPAYAGAFAAHLYGSPLAIDTQDEQAGACYRTPFRAAMARTSGTHRAIVYAVCVAGETPAEAAVAAGVPSDVAKLTAEAVLRWFWRGMSSGPLPVPSTTS